MRYRFIAPAALVLLAVAVPSLAAVKPACVCDCPGGKGAQSYLPRPAKLHAKSYVAPHAAPHVRSAMRRSRHIVSDYAENYYDYRSESRIDDDAFRHHWQVAPAGYVPPPPMAPPVAMAPPPPSPAYGEGYGGAYGYQNGQIQGGFSGGVGYGAAEGGGGGGGVVTLAQPDGLNGPNYNSLGESNGGDNSSANRLSAWRAYNHVGGSNGY